MRLLKFKLPYLFVQTLKYSDVNTVMYGEIMKIFDKNKDHANVVKLVEYFKHQRKTYMIMGSLK